MPRPTLPTLLFTLLLSCLPGFAAEPAPAAPPPAAPTVIEYATLPDVAYSDAAPRCRLDLYYPRNSSGFATLVWFHGGGLSGGNKYLPEGLKGQGIAVVSANYRLMPQAPIEACLEDAAAALAWTLRNIQASGGDPRRVFVGGHSAGAYLATLLTTDPTWMAKAGFPEQRVAGLLAISGQMATHFGLRAQRGMPPTQIQADAFAPFFHIKAGLPPILLVTGDREMELYGRYEENAYYARMLRLAGNTRVTLHELQGYNHGEMVKPAEALMVRQLKAWCTELDQAKVPAAP